MNVIIPMAGMGKRLRPHTLTTPKPLIPIAGKPIVQRLVEDIAEVVQDKIENIGFVVGDFGEEVEKELLNIAQQIGAKGHIFYQEEALGTAHAVYCAKDILRGKTTVAFADTLFRADFKLNSENDGIIWVKKVKDPSAYGVVTEDSSGFIDGFVEKPRDPVSDLAIIGIYYFKEGEKLKAELNHLLENNIMSGGEYQLTTALENLKKSGLKFTAGAVSDWLDCGNKTITVASNKEYLGFIGENKIDPSVELKNTTVIPPVYIGANTVVENSVIGPFVSLGENGKVINSIIRNSLIQTNCSLTDVNLNNSMLGNYVTIVAQPNDISLGDFSEWKG